MKMGISLIVVGVLFIGAGVWAICRPADKVKTFEDVDSETTTGATENAEVSAEAQTASNAPTSGQSVAPAGDSKQKGNDFEGYVADMLKSHSVRITEWNQGTTSPGGAYGENELKPDFFVSHNAGRMTLEYWVECKFRSSIPQSGFELKDTQTKRYKELQGSSKRKVFIALGLGGSAKKPDRLFIVPLDSLLRFKHIPQKYLDNYEITPKGFDRHMKDYFFDEVFKK